MSRENGFYWVSAKTSHVKKEVMRWNGVFWYGTYWPNKYEDKDVVVIEKCK